MESTLKLAPGIKNLLNHYRRIFRIPENVNHYSDEDYRCAERKFVKYALDKGWKI